MQFPSRIWFITLSILITMETVRGSVNDNCGSRFLPLNRSSCSASSMLPAQAAAAYTCARQCSQNPLCRLAKLSRGGACELVMESEALSFTVSAGECAMLRIDSHQLAVRGNRQFFIFQQRLSDSVGFVRGWTDYETGFGDRLNFWAGLRWIHALTRPMGRTMQMEATRFNGLTYQCEYAGFLVQGPSTGYVLQYDSLQSGSSNVSGDSLHEHRGRKFQTTDVNCDGTCCAKIRGGTGWWFNFCESCNPNGIYHSGGEKSGDKYVNWDAVIEKRSLKEIRLMLQDLNCAFLLA